MAGPAVAQTPRPGLRERKKHRTRQTIVDVALKLFAGQGYAETTLAEIADAAEISTSTFFNYFSAKDAIVFALTDQVVASARDRVANRPDDEATADAIVSWITSSSGRRRTVAAGQDRGRVCRGVRARAR